MCHCHPCNTPSRSTVGGSGRSRSGEPVGAATDGSHPVEAATDSSHPVEAATDSSRAMGAATDGSRAAGSGGRVLVRR